MKKIFTQITLGLLLLSGFLFSQNSWNLELKNGSLPVEENFQEILQGNLQPAPGDVFEGKIYVGIQFYEIPSDEKKAEFEAKGIHLMDYLPMNTYIASIPEAVDAGWLAQQDVRGMVRLETEMRLSPELFAGKYPAHAQNGQNLKVRVTLQDDLSMYDLPQDLTEPQVLNDRQLDLLIEEGSEVAFLDANPWVKYLEAIPPAPQPEDFEGRSLHRSNAINTNYSAGRHYDGSGVVVGLADDGLIGPHIDYTGRLTQYTTTDNGTHGDMTAGIMFGSGNRDPRIQGHASGAFLHYWSINGYPHVQNAVSNFTNMGLVLTSTSYSQGSGGVYTTDTEFIDGQIYAYPALMHVFSAGNAGSGWETITGGYKAGKNVITCGNLSNLDVLESSSSRGPTEDGRIKPDICANGFNQLSTLDGNSTQVGGGTSAAAPSVAGCVTQLYQVYREANGGQNPQSALLKGSVLNTAEDLGQAGPDFEHGWGRINTLRAARVIEDQTYVEETISQGGNNTHQITVPSGTAELRVMIYWSDYAGNPAAARSLVNDLDMTLTLPNGNTEQPWLLNPNSPGGLAVRGVDNLNNVEQIVVDAPAAGVYNVNVAGTTVPQGPQTYFMIYCLIDEGVELTYPIGGEGFVPGVDEILRWDAYGINNNFQLEYSTDNGTSWNSITNLSAGARQYVWNPPATVTGRALVKVTRGNHSDVSDGKFSIIDVPSNLTVDWVCPDSIGLSWGPVTGAIGYEVSHLGAEFMDSIAFTTQTNISLTGLDPNSTHWFSVRAITPSGNKGLRAVAVEMQPGVRGCTVPLDASISRLSSPQNGTYFDCLMSSTMPVEVDLTNPGQAPISNFTVSYSLNGGSPVTETITGPLAPGASMTYTFASTVNLSGTGSYTLDTWVTLAGDGNPLNDSAGVGISVITGVSNNLPYSENFETFPTCGTNSDCGATICNLANGWLNLISGQDDDFDWRTDEGGTPSNGTGPNTDHNPGTSNGNYLYTEASGTCFNQTALMISPCINLSGATAPVLEFWYHMNGADMGDLHVDVFSGGIWYEDVMPPLLGQQGNNWLRAQVSLGAFSGQTISVRFRGVTGPDFSSDIAIDDVSIANSTLAPSTAFTGTPATICAGEIVQFSDNSANAPTSWAWTITPSAGVSYVSGNANTPNPAVQFANTGTYTVKLVSSNGNGIDSLTQSNYITVTGGGALPFNEDFETFSNCGTGTNCELEVCALNNGWINLVNGSEDEIDWRTDNGGTPSNNTGPGQDHNPGTNGGKYLYLEASGPCDLREALLRSPCVDLSGQNAPSLEFWYHMWGVDMGELHVDVVTGSGIDYDVTTFIIGDQGNAWRQRVVDLSPWSGQTIRIQFRGITGVDYTSDIAIDDVSIVNNNAQPTAAFTTSPQGGCLNSPVSLVDQSTNNPNSWNWSISPSTFNWYSGGATSQSPSVAFTAPGTYTITLTAGNANGSDTETQTVVVNSGVVPTVSIAQTGGSTPACAGEPLSFTATGTNGGTGAGYTWLVNGNIVSTGTNNVFTTSSLANGDVVTCELNSTETCADPQTVASNGITVAISGALPTASFSYTTGTPGATYIFADNSLGTPTSWSWDFGDGNTSTSQNPSNLYTADGNYTVTLIVTNSCGSDTLTQTITGVVSIGEEVLEGASVQVFPNPSSGRYTLRIEDGPRGDLSWQVTDLRGRVLRDGKKALVGGSLQTEIDLSGFSGGLYLLNLRTENGRYVHKLILE